MHALRPNIEDPLLRGLARSTDPEWLSGWLGDVLGGPCAIDGIEVLKHKPGKRCAVGYSLRRAGERIRLFGKTFRTDRGARIHDTMATISGGLADSALRVPRPVAYHPKEKLLVCEFLDGAPLGTALYGGVSFDPARRAARAIAALHRAEVGFARRWDLRQEIESAMRWSLEGPAAAGGNGERLRGVLARCGELAAGVDEPGARPVHRDFYLEQLWDLGHGTALLDLDDAREGDPAVDVGNFLAHLTLRGLQYPVSAEPCSKARAVFLEEYLAQSAALGLESSGLERRVGLYELTTLVRLTGVYAVRPRWSERLPGLLLDRAERAMEEI